MLTDDELVEMRATLDDSLPDLADITRATPTSDGRGGRSLVWAIVASVPCRVAPYARPSEEQIRTDQVLTLQRWWLTFPQGTNVTPADRIVVGTRTFEVIDVLSTRSYEVSCRVLAAEVI